MHGLPLPDASVTNSLVTLATHFIRSAGYTGVAVLIFVSALIAVPGTEGPMLFAGFNVDEHHLGLVGIIVAGVLGDVIGATAAYLIGRFGFAEALMRWGESLHVGPQGLDRAHRWFGRYGDVVMPFSRIIPVARCAFPYAAGVSRMPFWRFLALTTLGTIVWIVGLAFAGKAVGNAWPKWRHDLGYVDDTVVVIVVLLIVWFVVQRVRGSRAAGPTV